MESQAPQTPFWLWAERRFIAAAAVILTLAALNLFFRLDREIVREWDESLYATSAAETAANGTWIGTTFDGALDYYNTKPPLNVWLIALAFKAFGVNLVSLRLPSAFAAWLTVLVLMVWARRSFGAPIALMAGVVLSTTFGFLYVHSARNANTDALFGLLMLLTAITLFVSEHRPWRLVWLGPIIAAAFLLRGLAVLMPLAMVAAVQVFAGRRIRERLLPLAVALLVMTLPIGAWAIARWQVDGFLFFARMFHYDLVARSVSALEGHTGTLLYYPNVLQKDQYEWLLAAVAALLLCSASWTRLREAITGSPEDRYRRIVFGAWLGVTVLIPTFMRTKVAWYLNPFFPLFALGVAAILVHGFS